MRIYTKEIKALKIYRNDVSTSYKQAWISEHIGCASFRNKFIDMFDSDAEMQTAINNGMSLFSHPKRSKLAKLLHLDSKYGTLDMINAVVDGTRVGDALADLIVYFDDTEDSFDQAEKDEILLALKEEHLDKYGYSFTITDGVINADTKMKQEIYSEIYNYYFSDSYAETYTFTWDQARVALNYAMFERSIEDTSSEYYSTVPNRNTYLRRLGVEEDISTIKNLHAIEFFRYISHRIRLVPIKKKVKAWKRILSGVLTIASIVGIVIGISHIIQAVQIAVTAGIGAALASTAALTGIASLGLGVAGTAILATLYIIGVGSSIDSFFNKPDEEEQTVDTPEEIDKQISIAEELHWTMTDIGKPESHIYSTLEKNKP